MQTCHQATTIKNFPFLSKDEFKHACESLVETAMSDGDGEEGRNAVHWGLEKEAEDTFVRVTRTLPRIHHEVDQSGEDGALDSTCIDEEDLETISKHHHSAQKARVEFHILHSPTYQVPVLYFFLHDNRDVAHTIDDAYQYLVPHDRKAEMRGYGVIGAISQSDHPVSGKPAFFVHPCNTASAMKELARGILVNIENYLAIWLGLAGPCVGLTLCIRKV